jgi:hypothetical protein
VFDFWENFIFSTAMAMVTALLRDPAKKAKLKEILLNLRNDINAAYPGE